ncbi:MAG: hypothetical protein ABIL16_06455 [candidate division WOR-3 bacterium]
MSEKEILDLWIDITGFEEDWRTLIEEIIDDLHSLAKEPTGEEEEEENVEDVLLRVETPETLIQSLYDLLEDLEDKIEEAKSGRLTEQELSYVFRKAGEYIERARELVNSWIYEEAEEEPEEEEEE